MIKDLSPEQIKIFKQVIGIDDITLRDRFAMAALANPHLGSTTVEDADITAIHAYRIADALIKRKEKK